MTSPKTLTKVAVLHDSLENRAKKFNQEVQTIALDVGNKVKYGLYNENPPYLMMVSQQQDKFLTDYGYNIILTISSDSGQLNQIICEEFRQKTGIEMEEAPMLLAKMMEKRGISLEVFKKYGPDAMEILKSP